MTFEDRQRVRAEVDARKRKELDAIRAIAGGQGRCKSCATRYEDEANQDCQTCRERIRIRRKPEVVPDADEVAEEMYGAAWGTA